MENSPYSLERIREHVKAEMKRREEMIARKAKAEESLIEFIRMFWHCVEPEKPFVDGWVIQGICEHLEAVTKGDINRLVMNVPPGFMKALDCNTKVLTTWGWKNHGDLKVDDFVYGPDGQPKRILGVTDKKMEQCYEIIFDDGSSVIAGEGHLWEVERDYPYGATGGKRIRKKEVVTTPELRESVIGRAPERPDRIALCNAVNCAPKRLLIDPYLLGAWLGDGHSNSGSLAVGAIDIEHFKKLGRIGTAYEATNGRKQRFYRVQIDGLHAKLSILGLRKNKHIPQDYLDASVEQRWELLRGLMDTDGTATKEGFCSFTNKNELLARQTLELAASLGLKAYINQTWSSFKGRKFGPYYVVSFTALVGMKIFNLARKQARVIHSSNPRVKSRYVKHLRLVDKRLVNCITVEGHLYLVTERFVTTHNSLSTDVFWPAWEWGPRNMSSTRYICTSSQAYLTERDNGRFFRIVNDSMYKKMWGDRFGLELMGVSNITNNKTGFKLATTVGGVSTGARGNRVIIDDPNSTDPKKNESEIQRDSINNWLMEVMPDRLNSIEEDAIVLIQQRTHETDATATLLERGQDYVWFCVPMEYDPQRHCETEIGWSDPRTEDGELAFPNRFPRQVIEKMKIEKGPVAYCTPKESPVLMADLSMKPIGEIEIGDSIMGFTTREKHGLKRHQKSALRHARVISISKLVQPVVKMTLSSGKVIRCTPDHKWYTARRDKTHKEYKKAKVGSLLMRVCEPHIQKLTTDIEWTAQRSNFIVAKERVVSIVPDGEEIVYGLETETGNYVVWGLASSNSGQYQQSPVARGGNIIKQDWWRVYDMDDALRLGVQPKDSKKLTYPAFDLVVVSVDTALTEKKENCYSGCTTWGIWQDENKLTKLMLIHAWQKRLSLHGKRPERPKPFDDETDAEYNKRYESMVKENWGLVEQIADTAKHWKAQAIIVENKANGPDVIGEIDRLYRKENWQVIAIDPKGDKVARVHATVPTFTQGLIYAPNKDWAQKVINQFASFPRGKDKDLVDSATQAILYLRNAGIIQRPDEQQDDLAVRFAPQGEQDENIYQA